MHASGFGRLQTLLAWSAGTLTLWMCAATAPDAGAENYPAKTVSIVVPFPAGSSADVTSRQVAHFLSTELGQSVIVDNRPGANGILGAQFVAKAAPDGHTLLFATSHMLGVTPHINRNPGFDALNDFVPITISGSAPAFLVVPAESPYRSAKELMDAAGKSPGKLSYASSGEGSPQHIMGEKLKKMAGIELLHVPYKGETPALLDLAGGRIDLCFGFAAGTMPHVRAGRLRALATTSEKRLTAFPDIPTLAEAGLPGYAERTLVFYLAPRGTSPVVVKKLNEAFRKALFALKREIEERGTELVASSPEEAAARIRVEYERYGKLVKELGIASQ